MIPKFLQKENIVKPDTELTRMVEAYIERFGENVSLECMSLTDEERCKVLKESISRGIKLSELLELEYDEDTDY